MMRPFQKSHNTAFRLLAVLLYGTEGTTPYRTLVSRTETSLLLAIRTGAAARALKMTIPRLREHLAWLQAIGLLSEVEQTERGLINVTLILPTGDQ